MTLRFRPILPRKILDSAELPCIGRNQRQLVPERLPCNQQIVFANWSSNGFHLRTKFTRKASIAFIECKLLNRSRKKADKELSVHFASLALRNAIPEFEEGDG